MNKKISILLCICLLLNILPNIFYADDSLNTASEWALDEILLAKKRGINQGLFAKDYQGNASRLEFTIFALNIYQNLADINNALWAEERSGASFVDITKHHDLINNAYNYGIIDGISKTEFKPDANLTREQLCTILYRLLIKAKADSYKLEQSEFIADYQDVGDISSWALEAMKQLNYMGIIKGSGNRLHPKEKVTREEAILMGYRLYNQLLSSYVAVGINEAMPITKDKKYQTVAIVRCYVENQDDEADLKAKLWHAIYCYVNLMAEDEFRMENNQQEEEFILKYQQVEEIAKAIFADNKEMMNNLESYLVEPNLDSLAVYYQKIEGEYYYYLAKAKDLDLNCKIIASIRNEQYQTVGFEMEYQDKNTNQVVFAQQYFKERRGHRSYDSFYYWSDKYLEKE